MHHAYFALTGCRGSNAVTGKESRYASSSAYHNFGNNSGKDSGKKFGNSGKNGKISGNASRSQLCTEA